MADPILYLTFDGVLQPLAYSQVVRVLVRLGQRGFDYRLLSLERPEHLEDGARVARLRGELESAGVLWFPIPSAPMRVASRALSTVRRALSAAARIVRSERIRLVHARGYQSAGVAAALLRTHGVPYIFDARGCWIEERAAPGEWFGGALSYAAGKLVEQRLFRDAAAVVTLTELQATDVREGIFGPPGKPVIVVPTCADYDAFYICERRPGRPSAGIPEAVRSRLEGKLVVGLVGSLNRSYEPARTMELVRAILDRRADAHLLVLSSQEREYRDLLAATGIADDRVTLTSAPHDRMTEWVHWIDWAPTLLGKSVAKRGSMPTKLAEFFAAGVRPIHHGCNEEAASWVRRAGSGIVLDELSRGAIEDAASAASAAPLDVQLLYRARARTAPHFSLASGVERYAALLKTLL